MKLSEVLRERGYVYQHSSTTLEEITDGKKRTVYLGVDPTADSIHLGNFVQYMFLRRFADAGHKIILVIGGGTALAGDPKPDVERDLADSSIVAERAAKLKSQAQKILGGVQLELVNNADWLTKLNLMEFLRDTGKHFTVNSLVKKEAISARMQSEDGISFTEFSYPLLQAYDFWHLYKQYGCDVQIGGSDQWGNIIAGVELIRRRENAEAFALSSPLIIEKSTGKKFGKSEGNAVWLDPEKTSPFLFYQFFLNVEDEMLEELLLKMTLLSREEIDALLSELAGSRSGQKRLAAEVTKLVHGEKAVDDAERVSAVLFGTGNIRELDAKMARSLALVAPSHEVAPGTDVLEALIASKLASSKREARQFLSEGAVSLNGEVVSEGKLIAESDFHEGIALLRRGKRSVSVLIRA